MRLASVGAPYRCWSRYRRWRASKMRPEVVRTHSPFPSSTIQLLYPEKSCRSIVAAHFLIISQTKSRQCTERFFLRSRSKAAIQDFPPFLLGKCKYEHLAGSPVYPLFTHSYISLVVALHIIVGFARFMSGVPVVIVDLEARSSSCILPCSDPVNADVLYPTPAPSAGWLPRPTDCLSLHLFSLTARSLSTARQQWPPVGFCRVPRFSFSQLEGCCPLLLLPVATASAYCDSMMGLVSSSSKGATGRR